MKQAMASGGRVRAGATPAAAPAWGLAGVRAFATPVPEAAERRAPPAGFSFARLSIQPKLEVGEPGDALEKEADQVADRVMRMPDPRAVGGVLQRKCAGCEEEGKQVQREAVGGAVGGMAAPPIVHDVLGTPGRPLDRATRAFMEPRFGHDFGGVRVHDDARADASARALSAVAYTVGRDLVFQEGALAPGTADGDRLLAHELAHVVQQSQGAAPDAVRRAVKITPARFMPTNDASPSMAVTPFIPGKWFIEMTLDAPGFALDAAVDVACGGGSAAGYEVGIVQVETSESSRATYFGLSPADGSLVASKSQVRKPAGPCQDARPGGAFWTAGAKSEISLKPPACGASVGLPSFEDRPAESYPGWLKNSLTQKPNYVRDVTMSMSFTDALAVKTPAGNVSVLRWLTWGVDWAGTFKSDASGSVPGPTNGSSIWAFGENAQRPGEIPLNFVAPATTCVEIAAAATSTDYVVETNASY
jgi:Domain of unknown function (DUF4157)